jgi:hypothetical protein
MFNNRPSRDGKRRDHSGKKTIGIGKEDSAARKERRFKGYFYIK